VGDDRWVPPVNEGERKEAVPFREFDRWATGWFSFWAERVPRGLSLFFFDFFTPFLFSDFRFVSKSFAICFNSNQTNS
jgi:hypothetical protein